MGRGFTSPPPPPTWNRVKAGKHAHLERNFFSGKMDPKFIGVEIKLMA